MDVSRNTFDPFSTHGQDLKLYGRLLDKLNEHSLVVYCNLCLIKIWPHQGDLKSTQTDNQIMDFEYAIFISIQYGESILVTAMRDTKKEGRTSFQDQNFETSMGECNLQVLGVYNVNREQFQKHGLEA